METPAAAPRRAKRRKREAPNSREPATSAPESSHPGAGGDVSRIQDPPPGAAGDEDGVDRISLLPDAILREVISLLPTMDAARTQILATPWHHLWRSAPLNLDGSYPLIVDVISRILSAHRGPGRRFRFPANYLLEHSTTMDAWLRSPALDNLQEIDCFTANLWRMPPLPASTFRFSSSLCVATFSQCHLSDDITQALQFPRLKKLALQGVGVSENSLHSIIAASPVLECLLLRGGFGFRCVRINSATLTSLGVSGISLEEVIVVVAPCLKRILYLRSRSHVRKQLQVSVISSPNVETLGCLNFSEHSSRLVLGSTIIEPCNIMGLRVTNSTTPACTVKILAVDVFVFSLDAIIDLLRCFPCLEKLYIQAYQMAHKNFWRRKHRNLLKCIDIRLKTVVLNNYQGVLPQVNFATFFILNAKMLESMTFECQRGVSNRFLAEQHQMLQLEKKASRCARFNFTTERCPHEFMHINHVHDMSKTDPFQCEKSRAGVCASLE